MAVKEFTVEDKLRSLHHLQTVHSKLDEIVILKGELPIEVKDLEDEIEGLQTRMEKLKTEIDTFDKSVADRKNAIKDSQALIKKYEGQQKNVKNSREFDALTKEIEMQTLEVQLGEKRIRDAEADMVGKKQYLEEAQGIIDARQKDLEAKRGELDKIVAETEAREKELGKELDSATNEVDDRLLTAFNRIRKSYRNGLAVVSIERDSCGGCYSKVPPQRQMDIRQRKKIIVCEHCGRILVDPEIAGLVAEVTETEA